MNKQGYLALFKEMFGDIFSNHWLTFQLFKRNFTATYRQSVLGVFWAVVVPLASVVIFAFLNNGGVLNVGNISVHYPLFAMAGTSVWQLFSVGLTLGTNSVVSAGAFITKINFPKKTLVVSAVLQGFITFLIPLVIVLILFAVYLTPPPLTILLVPFAVIPLLLLTLGLGFFLSLVNGVVRDVGSIIILAITFLLFATPVLYAKPPSGIVGIVSSYNPLYYLVAVPRDLMVTGKVGNLQGFFYAIIISLVVFLVGLVVFHISEDRITERV